MFPSVEKKLTYTRIVHIHVASIHKKINFNEYLFYIPIKHEVTNNVRHGVYTLMMENKNVWHPEEWFWPVNITNTTSACELYTMMHSVIRVSVMKESYWRMCHARLLHACISVNSNRDTFERNKTVELQEAEPNVALGVSSKLQTHTCL